MSQEPATQVEEQIVTDGAPPVTLQVGDIEAAIRVIDYAAEQGSFKGWSIIQEVMVLRNRLVAFLKTVPVPAEAEAGADPEQTTEVSDEVPESPAATSAQ